MQAHGSGLLRGLRDQRASRARGARRAHRRRAELHHHWVQAAPASNIGEVEQRISELEADLADAKRKVKRAHTAYVDAEDDMASIALEELHRRRAHAQSIESELSEERQGYAQAMTAPSDQVDLDELRRLLAGWDTFDDNDKRVLIETMIDYVSRAGHPVVRTGLKFTGPPRRGLRRRSPGSRRRPARRKRPGHAGPAGTLAAPAACGSTRLSRIESGGLPSRLSFTFNASCSSRSCWSAVNGGLIPVARRASRPKNPRRRTTGVTADGYVAVCSGWRPIALGTPRIPR